LESPVLGLRPALHARGGGGGFDSSNGSSGAGTAWLEKRNREEFKYSGMASLSDQFLSFCMGSREAFLIVKLQLKIFALNMSKKNVARFDNFTEVLMKLPITNAKITRHKIYQVTYNCIDLSLLKLLWWGNPCGLVPAVAGSLIDSITFEVKRRLKIEASQNVTK